MDSGYDDEAYFLFNTSDVDVPRNVTFSFVINVINYYYPPLIVLLGTVGNLLSLAVFRYTKLRQLSTSCYLTALSLSDTGCLLSYLATWMDMMGVNVYNRPVCCQLLTYFLYVCGFMSPWFVVAFTVERFVATCYPLQRAAICTVSRAQGVVAVLSVIAAVSYVYILVMAGVEESSSKCGLKPDHLDTMNVLNFLDTIATLIVPVILITGLNVLIARAVWQFEKVRRSLTMSVVTTPLASSDEDEGHPDSSSKDTRTTSSLASSDTPKGRSAVDGRSKSGFPLVATIKQPTKQHQPHQSARCCYQLKITKMLLIISTVFVGLNAPSYIVRLWVYFGETRTDSDSVALYNLQQWAQLLFNLNFAINFLLYCVSGQNFRRSLKSLFWRVARKADHGRHLSRKSTGTFVTNSAPVSSASVATNNIVLVDCAPFQAVLRTSCRGAATTGAEVVDSV